MVPASVSSVYKIVERWTIHGLKKQLKLTSASTLFTDSSVLVPVLIIKKVSKVRS